MIVPGITLPTVKQDVGVSGKIVSDRLTVASPKYLSLLYAASASPLPVRSLVAPSVSFSVAGSYAPLALRSVKPQRRIPMAVAPPCWSHTRMKSPGCRFANGLQAAISSASVPVPILL